MSDALTMAIGSLLRRGGMLPPGTRRAAERSLRQFSDGLAGDIMDQAVDRLLQGVASILKPGQELRDGGTATVGDSPQSLRADLLKILEPLGSPEALAEALRLDFKIKVAVEVAQGAGRFVADQTNVDAYPAWELLRVYDREIPRGEEPVHPSDPWPVRWRHAAEAVPEGELLVSILEATGRMVALKSSGIWEALGDGAGGYTDTLGNPFPPFAFNSGYDTEGVSYDDCVELGLLRAGQTPQTTPFAWDRLLNQEAA